MQLMSSLVAATILGIVSVPIAQLSIASVKTRATSELYNEAEQLALGVRKAAARANTLEINNGTLLLDSNTYSIPNSCRVAMADAIGIITCTSNRGGLNAQSSQPLYSSNDLAGNGGNICWSGYQSQQASNNDQRSATYITDTQTFNQELTNPGNSGWGFVQVHDLRDSDCQTALANGGQLLNGSTGSNESDSSSLCQVGNYIGLTFNSDPNGNSWNSGALSSTNYSKKNKKVNSQSPTAGSEATCNSTITLIF